MPHWQGTRKVTVVTAYMRNDGIPDFTLNEVEVTQDEHANGVHYDRVEALLTGDSFEEPLIHFDEFEAPPFLIRAVAEYLKSQLNKREPAFSVTR